MSDVSELQARIDGAFTSAKERAKQQQQSLLQGVLERQKQVKEFEKVQARIVEIAKPRLEALVKRAGDQVKVTPTVSDTRRSAALEFRSTKAYITLTFSVAPDMNVEKAVVEYDLRIIPVLWQFESHAQFSSPITAFDTVGLAKWLDDRIVGFVEFFIKMHESEIYDKAEYVEDPVAKVQFPKFAAGATLDHGGQTFYFIDGTTKAEFARQKGLASG
jgi:YHS domain-containing protein